MSVNPDLLALARDFQQRHPDRGKSTTQAKTSPPDVDPTLWDTPTTKSSTQVNDMSRLVYLLVNQKVELPPMIRRVLPFGKELAEMHHGVGAAGDVEQLAYLYESGSRLGEGSPAEIINIILRLLDGNTGILDPRDKLAVYRDVELLYQEMLRPKAPQEFVELDMSKDCPITEIPKFDSGFTPWDNVIGGFYQSLGVVIANPGTGKTSLCLSLMEQLVKYGRPTWFFENEIPAGPMQGRISPLTRRTHFEGYGRLFCGPYSVDRIESLVRADPDPERIIIFDSPDVQFGSVTGEKRLDLERDYQRLVLLKPLCKMIVVTSQPRRADTELSLKSVAESWGKAWYADWMVTVEKSPSPIGNEQVTLKSKSVKNRFGVSNLVSYYQYNYASMEAEISSNDPNEDWSEW